MELNKKPINKDFNSRVKLLLDMISSPWFLYKVHRIQDKSIRSLFYVVTRTYILNVVITPHTYIMYGMII